MAAAAARAYTAGVPSRSESAAPDAKLLFCPFCGECFEAQTHCPDHELPLVDFEQLDRVRGKPAPSDDEALDVWEWRFGRGWIFAAVALWTVGFFAPLVSVTSADAAVVWTSLEVATARALNLWIIPSLSITLTLITLRRRTAIALRRVRLAVAALSLVSFASLGFTAYRLWMGAQNRELALMPSWGAALLLFGSVCTLIAAFRLGRSPPATAPRYRVEG